MKLTQTLRAIVLLTLVAGVSRAAHAEEPAPFIASDRAASDRADELTKQGLALAKADRYKDAEPLVREAWSLKRSYDIAGNLGIIEARIEKWRDAAEHLTYAFKTFPGNAKPEQKKLIELTLAKVLAHVTAVRVTVDVEKAEVFVDGRSVGLTPLADTLFVEPGRRNIAAKRQGYVDAFQMVDAMAGGNVEVPLVLRAEAPARRSIVPGAVLGGVAGVALVTGIGLFAGGRSKASSIGELRDGIVKAGQFCVAGAPSQDPRCDDLRSQASTANTLQKAGVGLMVGGGVAAVGTLLYFVLPSSAKAPASAVRVTPELTPSTAGLLFSGSF